MNIKIITVECRCPSNRRIYVNNRCLLCTVWRRLWEFPILHTGDLFAPLLLLAWPATLLTCYLAQKPPAPSGFVLTHSSLKFHVCPRFAFRLAIASIAWYWWDVCLVTNYNSLCLYKISARPSLEEEEECPESLQHPKTCAYINIWTNCKEIHFTR